MEELASLSVNEEEIDIDIKQELEDPSDIEDIINCMPTSVFDI